MRYEIHHGSTWPCFCNDTTFKRHQTELKSNSPLKRSIVPSELNTPTVNQYILSRDPKTAPPVWIISVFFFYRVLINSYFKEGYRPFLLLVKNCFSKWVIIKYSYGCVTSSNPARVYFSFASHNYCWTLVQWWSLRNIARGQTRNRVREKYRFGIYIIYFNGTKRWAHTWVRAHAHFYPLYLIV